MRESFRLFHFEVAQLDELFQLGSLGEQTGSKSIRRRCHFADGGIDAGAIAAGGGGGAFQRLQLVLDGFDALSQRFHLESLQADGVFLSTFDVLIVELLQTRGDDVFFREKMVVSEAEVSQFHLQLPLGLQRRTWTTA